MTTPSGSTPFQTIPATATAPQASWVTLSGRDARDFLHRLTTVNVNQLAVGEGAPGFFLTPQGKVRAWFTLWNFGPEDFAFEFDSGEGGKWKTELLATIDQYTFAEKITVTDVAALECRWIFSNSSDLSLLARLGASALAPYQTIAVDEEIRLCNHGSRDFGRPWITAWGRPARLMQWLERALPEAATLVPAQLESWRIQALRPRIDREVTSATIPLEAGLHDGIAQAKGCYPGQEVIERIISLGAPARRLARIEGEGLAPVPGDKIVNSAEPPAEVGEVTSVSADDGTKRFVALGYVRKIHAKEGLKVRFVPNAGTPSAATAAAATLAKIAPYSDSQSSET